MPKKFKDKVARAGLIMNTLAGAEIVEILEPLVEEPKEPKKYKCEGSDPEEKILDVTKNRGNPWLGNWTQKVKYPWKANEDEIKKLLYWLNLAFERNIKYPYHYAFQESGMMDKVGLRKFEQEDPKKFNYKCWSKMKYLMIGLTWHPALLTEELKELIEANPDLKRLIQTKEYKLVKSGNEGVIVKVDDKNITPLVQEQAVKDNIMEGMMDKLELMIQSMTPKKIEKANLGVLTKSFENIMKGYLMFKDEVGPKNMTQINIQTLNLQQKRELSLKLGKNKRE